VVFAEETVLGRNEDSNGENVTISEDDDGLLQPLGIRRWKLQKILFEAVQKAGIPIYFSKEVTSIDNNSNSNNGGEVTIHFADGTEKVANMLLAADGAKSPIRTAVAGNLTKLTYTGTTCLYGTASVAREARGICFPSSDTTKCHGCFYPIGPNEQCFQFHIPTENPNTAEEGGWGALLEDVGKAECRELANRLLSDGWDEKYLQPLYHVDKAMKVPFVVLKPHLPRFVFGRVVLVGDAAHPPVPYLGQGAQQGLEDAGTLALLFREAMGCETSSSPTMSGISSFLSGMDALLQVYDKLRAPRTAAMAQRSQGMGDMQQKRAENARYNEVKEELIRRDVFFHETMPTILPGVSYDYRRVVTKVLEEESVNLLPLPEEETLC
jgi:2-polyprenyl-6-methoxyphenol hydroxylase-like FAD-dependent oxidoreductase